MQPLQVSSQRSAEPQQVELDQSRGEPLYCCTGPWAEAWPLERKEYKHYYSEGLTVHKVLCMVGF